MPDLERARDEIDRIDRTMARLFRRRMEAVSRIAAYKKKNGLPVLDSARESAVMDRNMKRLASGELAGYYASFLANLLFLSRRYEARLMGSRTLACREDEQGFAAPVQKALYPKADLLPTATHRDVFEAVEAGDAALGLVAFSEGWPGGFGALLDLCYSHKCCISAVARLQGPPAEQPAQCMVLSARPALEGDHAALILAEENPVGHLAEVAEALAAQGLEIEQVKSRPVPGKANAHYYYIQLKNPQGTLTREEMAGRMGKICPGCRLLGVFGVTALAAG